MEYDISHAGGGHCMQREHACFSADGLNIGQQYNVLESSALWIQNGLLCEWRKSAAQNIFAEGLIIAEANLKQPGNEHVGWIITSHGYETRESK